MRIDEEPVKDDAQRPVPERWRPVLREIAEAIRLGDPALASRLPSVAEVPTDTAAHIRDYVADYGEALIPLPEESWDSSVALWQGSFWEVLVDLYGEPRTRTDLVLHVQVFEDGASYRFHVGLVYVP